MRSLAHSENPRTWRNLGGLIRVRLAFVLNYIPFIGPFIATLFPTLLAMTQFESWETVLGIFVCLNIIQFVAGSYVEPRVSGSVLSISPFVVLFAIFLWTFIWGLFGAFIGVPIA